LIYIYIYIDIGRGRRSMDDISKTLAQTEGLAPGFTAAYRIEGGRAEPLYISPELLRFCGLGGPEAAAPERLLDAVYPADREPMKSAVLACLRGAQPESRFFRVTDPEGGAVWVYMHAKVLSEDGGRVIICTFENASAQAECYRELIDSADVRVYVCDRNTNELLYQNRLAKEYAAGRGITGAQGANCGEYVRGGEPCRDCGAKDMEPGVVYTHREDIAGTGEQVNIEERLINWCGREAFVQYIKDITPSEDLRGMLESSELRYRSTVDGAGLCVWEYDVAAKRIYSPDHSLHKYGIPDVIEGVPEAMFQYIRPEDVPKMKKMYSDIDAGAERVSGEFWAKWLPGRPRRCERIVYTVMKDSAGRPVKAYGVGQIVTAQKQEEERLRREFRDMLENNPRAICSFSLELTGNTCALEYGDPHGPAGMLGSETADGLFDNIAATVFDGGERRRFREIFDRLRLMREFSRGAAHYSFDYRAAAGVGCRWVNLDMSMQMKPMSDEIAAALYISDCTESKTEQEISQFITNEEYDFVALLQPETRTIEFRHYGKSLPERYRGIYGRPRALHDYSDVYKKAAGLLVEPEERSRYLRSTAIENIVANLNAHGRYEYSGVEHGEDGSVHCRKLSYYFLDESKTVVLITQTDVTDLYLREQEKLAEINAQARKNQDILDIISTGICVVRMPDPHTLHIEYANQHMYRLLGYSTVREGTAVEEDYTLVGRYLDNPISGVHPDDAARVRQAFTEGYHRKHFTVNDYRILCKNGSYIWIREDVELREVKDGCRRFYATFRDVGEELYLQKELTRQLGREQALRQEAEKANGMKTEFLSSVSHDMRTPLNAVLGYDRLALATRDTQKKNEYLAKISKAGETLLSLINDTLDLQKIENGTTTLRLAPVSCGELIKTVVTATEPSIREKSIEFVLDNSGAVMATINVDALRVEEIFINLLSNAVKFTPPGGRIDIIVECVGLDEKTLHDKLTVRDTGIGISRGFMPKLFEPFAQERTEKTAHIGGSGLGLTIVKKLVDLMGGRIEVKSELGKGTEFTVYLDFERVGAVPAAEETEKAPGRDLSGRVVLLCEDNEMNREITMEVLGLRGVKAECAENGREGVEKFLGSPAGSFAAVLMDIRMPVMDGYEAARAIRALERPDAGTVPIIAITADAYEGDVKKVLEAGMDSHITKPIDPGKLFSELEKFMK
jgi:signal transduction histidine kinase